jgi:hypothetical protein
MKKIILDTDMLTDCDDAGAMAMLHAFENLGEIEILGIVVNGIDNHGKHSAVISAINYYFGRSDIPVGVTKQTASPSKHSTYSKDIFDEYKHDGLLDIERPDAGSLYEQLLSAQTDQSVTIVSIGFLTNLANLLKTENGRELFESKVKEVSIMGGRYPSGAEYNFNFNGTAKETLYFMEHYPKSVPIVFTGFEFGIGVITGKGYKNAPDSPMRRAYELTYDSINVGRPSWDQIALLYGVRGETFHGQKYFSKIKGVNSVAEDGSNEWAEKSGSNESYLTPAMPEDEIAKVIENLMLY